MALDMRCKGNLTISMLLISGPVRCYKCLCFHCRIA